MRHFEGRKERKADEEIKGGHSTNELVRSASESETVESAVETKNCEIIISI